jgi:hypothetical protein
MERGSSLGRGDGAAWSARGDVCLCPIGELADRGRALADGFGDLVVLEIEHLAQHEHRPFDRRERLQHQQHRHRDAVGQFDVLGHVRRGQQRLGDFALWLGTTFKVPNAARTVSAVTAGTINPITKKFYLDDRYKPRTIRHSNAVIRSFYTFGSRRAAGRW